MAHPDLQAWTDGDPVRLVQHTADRHDPEPTALACSGLWRADTQARLLRLVDGRPVRLVTTPLLGWLAARVADDGQQALWIVWDHASWPVSCAVRTWIKAHNQRVTRAGGCRLVICQLPSQSPWLTRMEPTWVHGTRAIAAPTRKLTGADTKQRLCTYYHCELLDSLAQQVA